MSTFNTLFITLRTLLSALISLLIKRIIPLIAHVTVCTILSHTELMVSPNPPAAIFGPIKAAAKTPNKVTTIPIGLALNTILKAL